MTSNVFYRELVRCLPEERYCPVETRDGAESLAAGLDENIRFKNKDKSIFLRHIPDRGFTRTDAFGD